MGVMSIYRLPPSIRGDERSGGGITLNYPYQPYNPYHPPHTPIYKNRGPNSGLYSLCVNRTNLKDLQ